jgi:hypothetical protein
MRELPSEPPEYWARMTPREMYRCLIDAIKVANGELQREREEGDTREAEIARWRATSQDWERQARALRLARLTARKGA